MYSGDDRRDAKDGDINEEDYNSDALYGVEDDSDSDDDAGYGLLDCDSDDSDQVLGSRLQEKYTILKGDARQEDYMTRVYSAQFDSEHPAFKRFCRNFADEDEVCKAVGRLDISSTNTKTAQGGKIKRCPAPGCDCAIQLHDSSGGYDVTCFCSYSFCWNCTEEAHRPVDCETVSKWKMERSRGSEDMKLILADAKACPKCKSPIEKRQGCMHMTCKPPCKYDFCWVCLGEWSDHTRDLYACNRYETAKQEGAYRRRRETRYAHYYERWATHESSRQKAVSDLQAVDLAGLSEKTCECDAELEAILEAWLQVVECRRVLKWSYVYGYYLPEQAEAKRYFFEHLQGEAEVALERLHQCAEKELQDASQDEFDKFRRKLAFLTGVTRHYFVNFVSALENGLSDVCPRPDQQARERGPTKGGGGSTP